MMEVQSASQTAWEDLHQIIHISAGKLKLQ